MISVTTACAFVWHPDLHGLPALLLSPVLLALGAAFASLEVRHVLVRGVIVVIVITSISSPNINHNKIHCPKDTNRD
eukprot:207988-Amphidinium_carterae.1